MAHLLKYVLHKYMACNIRHTKGKIKPKADWRAVDSPKKQINEFVLFAFLLFTTNKTNSFVRFLGEYTAHQSPFGFI